jgi:hypothetical protein
MKHRFILLVVAAFVLVTAEPAPAGTPVPTGGCGAHCGASIAEQMGIRYERPLADLKVGRSANATVLNASKLAPHGIQVRNNDQVVITLTSKNTFTVSNGGAGAAAKTVKFSFDGKGNLTPVH